MSDALGAYGSAVGAAFQPSDIRPGTIGMKKVEIAKALVEKDPSLMEPENQDKLMGEIGAIYDRDYAVKVKEVADAEVVGIMRSAAALHPAKVVRR